MTYKKVILYVYIAAYVGYRIHLQFWHGLNTRFISNIQFYTLYMKLY